MLNIGMVKSFIVFLSLVTVTLSAFTTKSKNGNCPIQSKQTGACSVCSNDYDCQGSKICCSSNNRSCAKSCMTPVFGIAGLIGSSSNQKNIPKRSSSAFGTNRSSRKASTTRSGRQGMLQTGFVDNTGSIIGVETHQVIEPVNTGGLSRSGTVGGMRSSRLLHVPSSVLRGGDVQSYLDDLVPENHPASMAGHPGMVGNVQMVGGPIGVHHGSILERNGVRGGGQIVRGHVSGNGGVLDVIPGPGGIAGNIGGSSAFIGGTQAGLQSCPIDVEQIGVCTGCLSEYDCLSSETCCISSVDTCAGYCVPVLDVVVSVGSSNSPQMSISGHGRTGMNTANMVTTNRVTKSRGKGKNSPQLGVGTGTRSINTGRTRQVVSQVNHRGLPRVNTVNGMLDTRAQLVSLVPGGDIESYLDDVLVGAPLRIFEATGVIGLANAIKNGQIMGVNPGSSAASDPVSIIMNSGLIRGHGLPMAISTGPVRNAGTAGVNGRGCARQCAIHDDCRLDEYCDIISAQCSICRIKGHSGLQLI